MSDTPKTNSKISMCWLDANTRKEMVEADFARELERELNELKEWKESATKNLAEARRIAEAYRYVWDLVSAAVDTCPNTDPLPWEEREV
jgi:hypothetical protein